MTHLLFTSVVTISLHIIVVLENWYQYTYSPFFRQVCWQLQSFCQYKLFSPSLMSSLTSNFKHFPSPLPPLFAVSLASYYSYTSAFHHQVFLSSFLWSMGYTFLAITTFFPSTSLSLTPCLTNISSLPLLSSLHVHWSPLQSPHWGHSLPLHSSYFRIPLFLLSYIQLLEHTQNLLIIRILVTIKKRGYNHIKIYIHTHTICHLWEYKDVTFSIL